MKIMTCPLNGPRNINEFAYGGEVEPLHDPNSFEDVAWAQDHFLRDNSTGIVQEWWCHLASSFWFIAERHRTTDEILRTYPATEIYNSRYDYPSA